MHSVNGVVMLKKMSDILSDKASPGLGTNLAMTFFVATNPMAVVPCAISCAWHSISGTILANIFARQSVPHASAQWGL